MAAYFHGNSSEIRGNDGLQTLILMNPNYVGFSDTQQHHHQTQHPTPNGSNNLVFFNSNTPGNSINLPHAPPPPPPPSSQQQQFVGIPLATTAFAAPSSSSQDGNNNNNDSINALHGFLARSSQYGFYNPSNDITAAREVARAHQQGLSLSLSSQQPGFGNFTAAREIVSPTAATGGSTSSASGVQQQNTLPLSSKYLKAAQELLDEVVNVGKSMKLTSTSTSDVNNDGKESKNMATTTTTDVDGQLDGVGESSSKHEGAAELSTAERQEIQMKKAKLVNMLDEVEQRYRHYHHQMQTVIHWLEQAAGIGSAKTYTALALQTISKQFRCLKDAIIGQIRSASKTLGEEDSFGGKIEGSRLKFVDNQLRQQRALQQLGMIQHNAWRPQRGLPERAVSVLRAWLFEHFLHPYPKDSDKLMLAKQTGLTRSQVSNWFINARVRLWKPMVEEMYLEEIKEHEQNGSDQEKTSKLGEQNEDSTTSRSIAPQDKSPGSNSQNKNPVSKQDNSVSTIPMSNATSISPIGMRIRNQSGFNLIGSPEIESFNITQGSPKKPRSNEMLHWSPKKPRSNEMLHSPNMDVKPNEEQMSMKFGDDRQDRDGFSLMGGPMNFMGGFGSYPIGEIARFSTEQFSAPYPASGTVSLTLGLPPNENLSMSSTHHSFLPIPTQNIQIVEANHEFGSLNTPTSAHSTTSVYENFNIQNRKRFAATLLPDFVT
ncbi:BEL1-like homeodomain protein 1 [Lycium barbarum]|uniref:BEL1-like homeodomain protein 1 n=1 Tax=Lycium barbarum TaxID=112863 RepID=UPI00293E0FA4|nr:BEL1-like homeodomain protein 1 [Lycium barbarum]XP_060196544.1 BEL1-like homeodomain protein 1 [Lycium barbarum]XP_060196546.1 BEL1-like homeodomain protein 1 [Lycium barbarum]